jgi:hypothetical protein
MTQDLSLRRKWTLRAHGKQVVFVKKPLESDTHVLTKALVWALFLPDYPDLSIETPIGHRYKPDLVQRSASGEPVFWAEAGRVGKRKMQTLVQRFRSTHFVFAKWNSKLEPFQRILTKASALSRRSAPVDLISFPADSEERFIGRDGTIRITMEELRRIRC